MKHHCLVDKKRTELSHVCSVEKKRFTLVLMARLVCSGASGVMASCCICPVLNNSKTRPYPQIEMRV